VFRRLAEPSDEARLRDAIEILAQFHPATVIEFAKKDDIRARLREDVSVRRRAENMRVLAGSVDPRSPIAPGRATSMHRRSAA